MNEYVLNEAIEDIKLIKQVIGKTAESLLSLGKIFLWWGFLFFIHSLFVGVFIYKHYDLYTDLLNRYPLLLRLVYPTFLLAGILIYVLISRKLPLFGLSKKIMHIWLFIIGFNIIVPNIVMSHDMPIKIMTMYEVKTALLITTFAIALYFTYILSNLKFIKWMSIVYIIVGFFAFLPGKVPYNFSWVVWPLTFVLLGVYFSYRKNLARGN